ncbi:MAG: LCP family protein [Chloroflexota bacterium]|nr:LCP family protein [Chloroflexota bacterium]
MTEHQGPQAPTTTTTPAMTTRRRPWYRRRLVLIPLILLILAGSGTGVFAWRLNRSFATIQEVTTPEPQVSGDRFGVDTDLRIDTGPAQTALQESASTAEGIAQDPDPTSPPETTDVPKDERAAITTETPAPRDRQAASVTETPATTRGETSTRNDQDSMTVLLMGVDARPGEAIDTDARPDALAVLHIDRTSGTCRMLAVPRDTRVELPGYGKSKVNHALVLGGIPYQQKVVSNYLGITIDHYGLIDFGGVVSVVDEVGGIVIDNPEAFTANGIAFDAGPQTLDGEQALIYARYRGGSDGDFGRIGRQQQVLRGLLDSASGQDLLTMIPRSLPLLEAHMRTDLGLTAMLDIVREFQSTCTADTLETETLPGTTATLPDPLLEMDLSYVIVEEADVRRLVAWLLNE